MNNLLIPLFLLDNLFSLFFKSCILLIAHLWVSKNIVIDEIISSKRSFEYRSVVMFEYTATLHAIFLPISIIAVTVFPGHFTDLMVAAIFECTLVCILSGNC